MLVFLTLSGISQVREKIIALHARRVELESAIAMLSRVASAFRVARGGVASAFVGDSPRASYGDGGLTLASVTTSLVQARLLLEQFDRLWGFARDRTLGASLEVCLCLCVCMCVFVCSYHRAIIVPIPL